MTGQRWVDVESSPRRWGASPSERDRRGPISRAALLAWVVLTTSSFASAAAPEQAAQSAAQSPAAQVAAARIDAAIERVLAAEQIPAAPLADDAEFLRRVRLDLTGRPPQPAEVRAFVADQDPGKRSALIDRLLASPEHAEHFAATWAALLIPEAATDPQLRFFQPGLEAWLREQRTANVGLDVMVRELIAVPIAPAGQPPQMVLRDLKAPNPIAYLSSKGADAATLAASTTRLFLGVRLECAQCHNHPFDSLTQTQFWNQAAFFAGVQRRGKSPFSPLTEATERRQVAIMGTDRSADVLYLDGAVPTLAEGVSPRVALADWITSPQNPWFARAMANRAWAQLMGQGLVHPVDDFGDFNPPSHPELLDELSHDFAASGFDLAGLLRSIAHSQAYQRTSRVTDDRQQQTQRFARMALKPLSGPQFFEVLRQALAYEPQRAALNAGGDEDPLRRRVLAQFPVTDLDSAPETSVSQALTLMNSTLTSDITHAAGLRSLLERLDLTDQSTEAQLDELYLRTVGRLPLESERPQLVTYIDQSQGVARDERLADLYWALLNSAEFRWNH